MFRACIALLICILLSACGLQQPILRPATSMSRMKYLIKKKSADTLSAVKKEFFSQIGYSRLKNYAEKYTYLNENFDVAGDLNTLYIGTWFGATKWLDIGIVSNWGGPPAAFILHGQLVRENKVMPAMAITTHLGFGTKGVGLAFSKTTKPWVISPKANFGPLEVMSNITYYYVTEYFRHRIPSLQGIQKPVNKRDRGLESKDFFDSFFHTDSPFLIIPIGVEFGINQYRIGFAYAWRFYIGKTRFNRLSCDDTGPEEYTNFAACREIVDSISEPITGFEINGDTFKMVMIYFSFLQ